MQNITLEAGHRYRVGLTSLMNILEAQQAILSVIDEATQQVLSEDSQFEWILDLEHR